MLYSNDNIEYASGFELLWLIWMEKHDYFVMQYCLLKCKGHTFRKIHS